MEKRVGGSGEWAMGTVLVVPPKSRYGVLTEFSAGVCGGLAEAGVATRWFDPGGEPFLHALNRELARGDVSHIVGFNAIALNELTVPPPLNVHYVAWLVDYPSIHYPRLAERRTGCSVISANGDDAAYVKEICGTDYAHADFPGFISGVDLSWRDYGDRPHSIVLAASWMGTPKPFWKEIKNDVVRKAATESLEELMQDESLDYGRSFKAAFSRNGIDASANPRLFSFYLNEIIQHVRCASRIRVVKALAESGLPTLVVGEGWDGFKHVKSFGFHPSVSSRELLQVYGRSKVVVNLNAKSGASERVVYGIQAGCGIATQETPELRNLFADKGGCVFLKPNATSGELKAAFEKAVDRSTFERMNEWAGRTAPALFAWREKARILKKRLGL